MAKKNTSSSKKPATPTPAVKPAPQITAKKAAAPVNAPMPATAPKAAANPAAKAVSKPIAKPITWELICERAYFISISGTGGDQTHNWLRAERELKREAE